METLKAKTFVLTNVKTWRREVRTFVMNPNKKFEERLLPFTTEHRVSSKQRTVLGHATPAEYITNDPVIIEALYRDPAYGKDFYERGDDDFKLKRPTLIVNDKDREIVALRGLFSAVGLYMDESLSFDVLKKQYEIHMSAISGKKEESIPIKIPHTPVDVKATIEHGVVAARQRYEDDYGEPIPEIVANDLAFLDGLSVPGFDAAKYIENKLSEAEKETGIEGGDEPTQKTDSAPANEKETLHKEYFAEFEKQVPRMKVNDLVWIKTKIEEKRKG